MTDILKNLKEDMNDTILKELDFNEKNKAAVRKSFGNKYVQSKKRCFPHMGLVLSVCFTIFFIGSISYFVLNSLGLNEQENLAVNEKLEETNEKEKFSIIAQPEPKENFEDMSKEDILTRLLNSVDYFETAAGTFETFDSYYDGSISKTKIEYKYSNNNVIGGYEKVNGYPDENNPNSNSEGYENERYYNNSTIWMLDLNRNEYVSQNYELGGKKDKVIPNDVFQIDLYKIYDSAEKFRERPPVSGNLFYYEFVAKYLRYEDQWEIEKQNEELLGHNTIVIYGHIDESIKETNYVQPAENSFRIWVDKDTGIIMKNEIYNNTGDVISYLHPSSLVINKVYEEEEFLPILDKYKERHIPNFPVNDERENDIEVIEHADAIPSSVQKVMEIQRETIPYFYEFNDTKVTTFSASIEEYKGQKQAYVVYSYDKPNTEQGSGSKLLYTRIYPRDSVVRTTGDFNSELGEEIENFTLNEIKWSVFEINGTPDIHLKGDKDGIIYEIVTQEVSLQEVKELLAKLIRSS
ncbi:hypothetical protein KHA93_05790 [Bacillus sp. FJAT-49732]|uniref:Uncharacterized protein n=1 Tax=Lederbergia citrisecunda TaxID=2833583 RepID=A0A942TK92_9BACI|nr:hypothetical protein [Lederbergia citrisecunda]MBS4199165.1 hypothetical protein [Lederbergia citrisecunda]